MHLFRLSVLPFCLLFVLSLSGCGGSGGDFAFSPSAEPIGTAGHTATVELRSVLAQTTVPGEVVRLRALGYDQQQLLRFGPVTKQKASVVEWTEVPVEVTKFVIEYLDANGEILGVAQVSVQLLAGQTRVVDNPTILGISISLQQLTVTPATRTIALGTSTQFTAMGTFSDGTTRDLTTSTSWSAGNSDVTNVTQGRAQGLTEGTSTITATFAGVSGQANLIVGSATLVSLSLSPNSPAIAQGTSQVFTVEGFFSDGSFHQVTADVQWTSSDENVATIDNSGLGQGLLAGQTTITATFGQVQTSTVLTVTSATLHSLTVEGGADSIAVGTTTQFTAIGHFSDGSTQDLTSAASWSAGTTSVADVTQGRAQGLAVGTSTITATFSGVSDQANLEVTGASVTSVRVETVPANGSTLVSVGQTLELQAVATFSDESEQVVTVDATWTSDNPGLATVNAGEVTGQQVGQTFINASFGGQSGKLQVTVQEGPLPQLTLSAATTYTFDTDSGVLTPQVGENPTAPGWNQGEGRLFLQSFTVESTAVLNVVGDRPFRVKAESSILVTGVIHFDGQDGQPGDAGAPGTVGQNGGDINLFSSADLTVTGTITANGGNGGAGGAGSSQGGNGGHGGDAGTITWTAGDNLAVDLGEISMDGGDGGAGGSASGSFATGGAGGAGGHSVSGQGGNGGVGGNASGGSNSTGGAGGAGGHSVSGLGGDGGSGGSASDNSNSTGGAGGAGGDGGTQGGNGGAGGNANGSSHARGGDGGAGGGGGTRGGDGGAGGIAAGTDSPRGGAGGAGGHSVSGQGGDGGDGGSASGGLSTTGGAGGAGGNSLSGQGGHGGDGGNASGGLGSAGGAGGAGGTPGGQNGANGSP